MKLPRRKFLHLAAGAAALPAVSRFARAQAYPTRPVRWIVPFSPGGPADTLVRPLGQWLSERLGQPFGAPRARVRDMTLFSRHLHGGGILLRQAGRHLDENWHCDSGTCAWLACSRVAPHPLRRGKSRPVGSTAAGRAAYAIRALPDLCVEIVLRRLEKPLWTFFILPTWKAPARPGLSLSPGCTVGLEKSKVDGNMGSYP
jgi:hypothetical protein